MNKAEIAAILRNEVGELEVLIKKLEKRLNRSKQLVLDIEAELAGPKPTTPEQESKFRKVVDQIFGDKPKHPKR
jgi:ribosome biogenesis SPOUT family RNA methylase Rps3